MTDLYESKSPRGNGTKSPEVPPEISPEASAEARLDIFDNLDALRLDPGESLIPSKEVLIHVPVRRPGRMEFVRVHSSPDMSFSTAIFRDDLDRLDYLVPPQIRPLLVGFLKHVQLCTSITRQGVLFLWPVPLPEAFGSGHASAWGDTARQAAALARRQWLRVESDMHLGAYRAIMAEGDLGEPTWPDQSINQLLKLAFKDQVIDRPDHPIIHRLRGIS